MPHVFDLNALGADLRTNRIVIPKAVAAAFFALAVCTFVNGQTSFSTHSQPPSREASSSVFSELPTIDFHTATAPPGDANHDASTSATSTQAPRHGLILRSVIRGLQDQGELYSAPFKPVNFKWDALLLGGTAVLIATDRRTTRALPTGHVNLFRNITNISLGSTSAAAGGVWAYGLKTKREHAKETGELELETLANTFLIYTPMQFIAGRERPEEATGNGRFWRHGGFNTSFPAGHPMFTWAMATVLAHEYPKPWVRFLAYGAATSVSMGRFLGREHYASDVLVGSVLGYAIATHIFHARCNPARSDACPR